MKAFILPLLFISLPALSQFTLSNSQGYRGQPLTTTITNQGSLMFVSSGSGSQYRFILKKGAYEISTINYTFPYTGLGFADYFVVNFLIPQNALVGIYDVVIRHPYWPFERIETNAFEIFESHLQGKVYFDANQNGIRDSAEFGVPGQKVFINHSDAVLTTDDEGSYNSNFHVGNIHDSLVVPPGFILTSPNSSYNLTIPPDSHNNDFGIYTPPDTVMVHDFFTIADPMRCLGPSKIYWKVSSQSNNEQNGTITIVLDSSITFVGSSLTPDFVSGDTIHWSYQLQPFELFTADLTVQGAQPNLPYAYSAIDSLFNSQGDLISVNSDTLRTIVRCSFDPNDKSVSPIGSDTIYHFTLKSETLTYTIRFQNCGTDTAYRIEVFDALSYALDWSTFELVYTSHPASAQLSSTGNLAFIFENILLPDSNTDEVNSHGLVVFRIKPMQNVPDYTFLNNSASIIFDNNTPVHTNNVFNQLVTQIPTLAIPEIEGDEVLIYPVPVTGNSWLHFPQGKKFEVKIFDLSGRLMIQSEAESSYLIQGDRLPQGIYNYSATDMETKRSYHGKFPVVK